MTKLIDAGKYLKRGGELVRDLIDDEEYSASEVAAILVAAAIALQGAADGNIQQSAEWFKDAMLEVHRNVRGLAS